MVTAAILHVGEDICRRIPVLERAGFDVLCSEQSPAGIAKTCTAGRTFSAIFFQNAFQPVPGPLIDAAMKYSTAPLVLFENPSVDSDITRFDLVVPGYTSPQIWLKCLQELISKSITLPDSSMPLREDCFALRRHSRELRVKAEQIRMSSFNVEISHSTTSNGFPR